eukprot:scaffold26460_cov129-Isochrysis_galbana.AAC.1
MRRCALRSERGARRSVVYTSSVAACRPAGIGTMPSLYGAATPSHTRDRPVNAATLAPPLRPHVYVAMVRAASGGSSEDAWWEGRGAGGWGYRRGLMPFRSHPLRGIGAAAKVATAARAVEFLKPRLPHTCVEDLRVEDW